MSGVIYTVKVVTDKGNIAATKYPDQASNTIVATAAIAQSVGDIAMELDQFKYAITSSTPLT